MSKFDDVQNDIKATPGLGKSMAKWSALGAVVAIPVPIVESGTSTPYPTQTWTRVDREAASTASTVGTSGQANSTIRPSRLRGPISTRPAVSHTAPSTRPQASPATT